jgi:gluconate 5-dehydrogenase
LSVAPGEEITPAQWDRVLDVNSRGLFFMLQAVCVQSMMARQSGAVVNIASVAGIRGMPAPLCGAHYSASKGAVIQITRQAAVEWGHHHIRVNAVAPGGVLTDRLQSFGPDFLAQAVAPIPMKKLSQPGDIANAVCFLASEAARMITGQVLVVDGGGTVVGV